MRTRALYKENKNHNLVWFNSAGLVLPDTVIVYVNNKATGVDSKYFLTKEIPTVPSDIVGTINLNVNETDINQSTISLDATDLSTKTNYIKIRIAKKDDNTEYGTLDIFTDNIKSEFLVEGSLVIPFKYFCAAKRYAIKNVEIDRTHIMDPVKNYSEKQESVADNLTQRLSVLKTELWWNLNYGLPILEKVRSKAVMDSVIINIILANRDVRNILSFKSSVDKKTYVYRYEVNIESIFGDTFVLSNSVALR